MHSNEKSQRAHCMTYTYVTVLCVIAVAVFVVIIIFGAVVYAAVAVVIIRVPHKNTFNERTSTQQSQPIQHIPILLKYYEYGCVL